MYFNNYINELITEVLPKERTLTLHPTLPKCTNITDEVFYYEQYRDNPEKHVLRVNYQEEGVWDAFDSGNEFDLEIRVNLYQNTLFMKAKHYHSVSGMTVYGTIKRYTAQLQMTEEEYFQKSLLEDLLPLEVHQYIFEYFKSLHEEYKNVF